MRPRNAYAAPAWAAEQRVGDVGSKAVLLLLANYADEEFSCYPSQDTVAEETEQSTRQVRRQVAYLESLGLIRREKRYNARGRTSDRFYLLLDVTVSVAPDDWRRAILSGATAEVPDRLAATAAAPVPDSASVEVPASSGRGTPRELPTTPRTTSSGPVQQALIEGPAERPKAAAAPRVKGPQQVVVDAWWEGAKPRLGLERAPRNLVGQVAREAKQLLDAGADPGRLAEVARTCGQGGFATLTREWTQQGRSFCARPYTPYRNEPDSAYADEQAEVWS